MCNADLACLVLTYVLGMRTCTEESSQFGSEVVPVNAGRHNHKYKIAICIRELWTPLKL